MADLQLAPRLPVGVMFPHNKTDAPGLHSAKQDPYEQGDSPQRSSMGHLRNTFPQKLLNNQELELENVHIHPKGNPCTKVRRSSYPCSSGVIHRPDSGSNLQVQEKGSFYPSSPQPQYLKASDQDFIPFPKKRVGVDRAYPLKPMFHRKSRNAGEVGTDREQNVCLRLPGLRSCVDSDFDFRSWMNASLVATVQAEKAMAELHKTERTQIQRLEAAGESLQKEIRRKELLLREKLKRTEEGLRRIQKEKEQAKEKSDRELQKMILPKRSVKDSNTKYKPVFSPEFMSEDVFRRDRREDETCELENPSPFQLPHYGIQRLKRERLAASNNKARDQRAEPSADTFSQSSEELDSAPQGSPRSSSLPGTPGSSESGCSTEEPELGKCNHCGRSFLLPRLERHSAVCGRMQGSKRKVFDSSRARAKGTELEQYLNWKGPATAKAEPRKSTWRQKHESFIRTLRHAREVQQIIAKGGNPSDLPPILPAANPDYVQCPHCSRHFAPKVAERHIPKCKTIKNRPPPPRKHES